MSSVINFRIFIRKILPFISLFLISLLLIEGSILYLLLIKEAENSLQKTTNRIQEDVILKNGKWDVSLYNSDSNIANSEPLYIITSEGLIIERSKPILGLLDLSRYSLITPYSSPTTVNLVTDETWRVLSSPILEGEQPIGVILVAVYKPADKDFPEIDKQLQDVINLIQKNITTSGDQINISKIDTRHLPYNVSFQIVNRFNKVLLQSNNSNSVNRIPTYIDRSYVDVQLKGNRQKQVQDNITRKRYLTLTTPLLDEKKFVTGIIVVGTSIDNIYSYIKTSVLLSFLTGIFLLLVFIPLVYFYYGRIQKTLQDKNKQKSMPKIILFMKKTCKLLIDDQTIDIPYSSYQFYFCSAIFSKPQKKWEVDELLEVFGEDFGSEKWRKVYDTMIALNRKTFHLVDKLFIVKDKRYFLNPELISSIKFSGG